MEVRSHDGSVSLPAQHEEFLVAPELLVPLQDTLHTVLHTTNDEWVMTNHSVTEQQEKTEVELAVKTADDWVVARSDRYVQRSCFWCDETKHQRVSIEVAYSRGTLGALDTRDVKEAHYCTQCVDHLTDAIETFVNSNAGTLLSDVL